MVFSTQINREVYKKIFLGDLLTTSINAEEILTDIYILIHVNDKRINTVKGIQNSNSRIQ